MKNVLKKINSTIRQNKQNEWNEVRSEFWAWGRTFCQWVWIRNGRGRGAVSSTNWETKIDLHKRHVEGESKSHFQWTSLLAWLCPHFFAVYEVSIMTCRTFNAANNFFLSSRTAWFQLVMRSNVWFTVWPNLDIWYCGHRHYTSRYANYFIALKLTRREHSNAN